MNLDFCPKCGKKTFGLKDFIRKKCFNTECQYTEFRDITAKDEYTQKNYKLVQALKGILDKTEIENFDFTMDEKGFDAFRRDIRKSAIRALQENQREVKDGN